jgi:hypothetical protein
MNWSNAEITVSFEDCLPGKKEAILRIQVVRDGNSSEMSFPIDEWEMFGIQAGSDDEKAVKLLLRKPDPRSKHYFALRFKTGG